MGNGTRGRILATPGSMVERMMRTVRVTESGCWEWTGGRNPKGYGYFYVNGGPSKLAHRMMWWLRYGDPGDLCVCHRCDNPPCINPHHLFLGTSAENVRDRDEKGRHVALIGEDHGCAILTWDDVRYIRTTPETGRALAERFGVSASTISAVRKYHTWKVDPEQASA